jgi:hypothetical protein
VRVDPKTACFIALSVAVLFITVTGCANGLTTPVMGAQNKKDTPVITNTCGTFRSQTAICNAPDIFTYTQAFWLGFNVGRLSMEALKATD